jgi:hypothetical protein
MNGTTASLRPNVDPSSGGSPWPPRRRETARRTGAGKSGNSQGKIPLMEKEYDRKIGTNDKKKYNLFLKQKKLEQMTKKYKFYLNLFA